MSLVLTTTQPGGWSLRGKRTAAVVFSHYPSDPRPRRAAEALAQQGMKVEVISLKQNPDDRLCESLNGVNILRVPLKRWRGGKLGYLFQYGVFIFASFLVLACRSLTRRYSLIHVHNMPDVLVFAALVPRVLGAKVLLDLHDPMPELMMTIFGLEQDSAVVRLLKRLERMSICFADAVLTVNEACRKIFSGRSCSLEKITVVMNSPDEGVFEYHDAPARGGSTRNVDKPFVIMYHGSLVERHGLDIAVSALEKVKKSVPQAQLRIYGQSTPFLQQVLDSIREPQLRQAIQYLGPRTLEQIVEAVRECDLGIIPNRRSIFTEINTPTRIFEYLSQGKPVIAPSVPGIRDYFDPDEMVYFKLGDAKDLAQKIEFVYLHPGEVTRIVRQGKAVYLTHKWSNERQRFLSLVKGLLSGQTKRQVARPAGVWQMETSSK
jgi:glycosyltransferase involved in cell wall biosynthesis